MSQPTPFVPPGPVSKRRQQRITNRRINTAATEADAVLRTHINDAATELGISATDVFQRFTLISPMGEQRSAMWWNGLVIEKSLEWKTEYNGPGRQLLSWVTHRIREEGLANNLTEEEQTLLETLHNQLGLEYMLVATRGKLEDDMPPLYASSDKVDTFLQGHMNMPMKDLLTHLDFYVIEKEGAGTKKIQNKKQALRSSVRTRLINSLCDTLKKMGVDTSSISCIEYANYDKIVYNYRVVLVGYPMVTNGRQMVRLSDFPGGIKGLTHADNQLASGIWRFEELPTTAYNEWKVKYEKAQAECASMPPAPYIPVPGGEFKKGPIQAQTKDDSGASRKRQAPQVKASTKARKVNKNIKSRETIEHSSSEAPTEPELGGSDDDEETEGSVGGDD
ncbi:hypothetical protein RSAG8_13514, partial [Rhizoctonia solani AG-8 WAC10335]